MLRSEAKEILARIKAEHEVASAIEELGGYRTETIQSDKLGFDWKVYYVGETIVKKEYIEQENPIGTADNPIVYIDENTPKINNAYYLIDGVRHVYMSGEFVEF